MFVNQNAYQGGISWGGATKVAISSLFFEKENCSVDLHPGSAAQSCLKNGLYRLQSNQICAND